VLATLTEHLHLRTRICADHHVYVTRSRCMLCNDVPRGSMQSDHVSLNACVIGSSMFDGIVHGDKIKVSYI
jgi:hypothetical protein